MDLRLLYEDQWKILAELPDGDDGACPLLAAFEELRGHNLDAHIDGLIRTLQRLATDGPYKMRQFIHEASKEKKIYGLRRGPIRVYFFYGDGALILCSHAIKKKKQGASKADVDRAADFRNRYEKAVAAKKLSMIPE